MARPASRIDEFDSVFRDYLRALARTTGQGGRAPSPGHDVRTCPSCGRRVPFALDPQGTWFRCSVCGRYA
jgi:hypothetical protein